MEMEPLSYHTRSLMGLDRAGREIGEEEKKESKSLQLNERREMEWSMGGWLIREDFISFACKSKGLKKIWEKGVKWEMGLEVDQVGLVWSGSDHDNQRWRHDLCDAYENLWKL